MASSYSTIKRKVDFQIISDWIDPGSRVLDLGCGRGVLLEHLNRVNRVQGIGIDSDFQKILACFKRGGTVYQGDIETFLPLFPDGFFDWVICSRTLQELECPAFIIEESLRIGRQMAVGFVNHGFWLNRWSVLRKGSRIQNAVYPKRWDQSPPLNPVSIVEFEAFCVKKQIRIRHSVYLLGDWKTRCVFLPNLRAGYALYSIAR